MMETASTVVAPAPSSTHCVPAHAPSPATVLPNSGLSGGSSSSQTGAVGVITPEILTPAQDSSSTSLSTRIVQVTATVTVGGGKVTDELDNQIISEHHSGDQLTDTLGCPDGGDSDAGGQTSERKRRLIGDEFYAEEGDEDSICEKSAKVSCSENGGTPPPAPPITPPRQPTRPSVVEDASGLGKIVTTTGQSKIVNTATANLVVGPTNIFGDIGSQHENNAGASGHELPLYNGSGPPSTMAPQFSAPGPALHPIMTATTVSVLDSVLVSSLIKNEPEDLTGHSHGGAVGQGRRHSEAGHSPPSLHAGHPGIPLDVAAKRLMGDAIDKTTNMVTSVISGPEGENHIVLTAEDLADAPGFPSTTIPYDTPGAPFSSVYSPPGQDQVGPAGTPARMYRGDSYTAETDMYTTPVSGGEGGGYRTSSGDVQYKPAAYYGVGPTTMSVDLPSPDSGIGDQNMTPRDLVSDSSFDYPTHNDLIDQNTIRKHWHDYGSRAGDQEKVQIPKVYSPYGFHYMLEAPTSSSVRREDDKVTYINKGQFYAVTLDYHPDPELSNLKSATVKTVILLVFRDGKSQDEEIKAWQFWHSRQHSVKQRIIDVDTKNSIGLVGHIEELSHNALAVYWNPLESPAKVNLAVQCLSTDFSTQKGVKGLPLHVQIDTYDDPRAEVGASPVYHRGYCQIKIFCDKGAERKLRDEERRAAKRRMTPSGKRRLDEMYHDTSDRSEFYSMSDLIKPPTLFSPPEATDPDKSGPLSADLGGFYSQQRILDPMKPLTNGDLMPSLGNLSPEAKRGRMIPPLSERIMIYVRQETEDVYTPLHLVPPTVTGLITAIENKYKINACNIRYLYRKNKDGIIAKIDDDMLMHYCNEDVFLMQVMVTEGPGGEETMVYDITLSELQSAMDH